MSDDRVLTMNPLADIHVHPQPRALPIQRRDIEVITVKCPVRGRGLVVNELTAASDPELFAFFAGLVERGGELDLDSDSPIMPALARIGFVVRDDQIAEWPRFRIALEPAGPPARAPERPGTSGAARIMADTFLFQPEFALHPGGHWPAEFDEQEGLLRCFAPGPAFWLGHPAELATPFWLDPAAAELLAGLSAGAPAPHVPDALAASLESVGAITTPAIHPGASTSAGATTPAGPIIPASPSPPPPARAAAPLTRFARMAPAFAASRFASVPALLDPRELTALREYYGALLAAGLVRLGDRQNPRRFSSYNDPVGRFVHARLTGAMSAIAARPVAPAFSFFASYVAGADLEPHRDRPEAEYSISIQLDYTPAPPQGHPTGWPLCFATDRGDSGAADLRIGDAVFYHGRELFHHRGRLPAGHQSSHLILEYVPTDFRGPLI
ncbi:MAG TPA: hypothetical protein VKB80_12725 [Kofleriaceae bacterium]|nr:hypothetical protein [Kofleriaceae bacterium]